MHASDVAARKRAADDARTARIAVWRAQTALPVAAEPEIAPSERPTKRPPSAARRAGGIRAAEKRAESDHEVLVNLEPWERPAWERVKRRIKATPYMSRTEAFAQWAHDHAGDVERMYHESCAEEAAAIIEETAEEYQERQRACAA